MDGWERGLFEAAPWHLCTAGQLRGAGIQPHRWARWVRTGLLVPVHRGVFTTHEHWSGWDVHRGRPLACVRGAHLSLRVEHVVSHRSAGLAHDLALLAPARPGVHVTRRELRANRRKYEVLHHAAKYRDGEVVEVEGLRVLDVPRTVADIARHEGYLAGLVAADSALQHGVGRDALSAAVEAMAGWPFVRTVRAVVDRADPGAESAAETLGRDLLEEMGFRDIETQFPARVPGGVAWCDLRVGRHAFEVDGGLKYRSTDRGGLVADGDLEAVVRRERRRQRDVCAGSLGMSRLNWEDVWGAGRELAKKRIAGEYAVTLARFGDRLSAEQIAFADAHRGARYRVSA